MADDSKNNPYEQFYAIDKNGYIFGRPLGFNRRADPGDRVFQKTILNDNTIINIVPGLPKPIQNSDVAKINEIIKGPNNEREKKMFEYTSAGKHKEANELAEQIVNELLDKHLDCRYITFKESSADFLISYQMLLNKVATNMLSMEPYRFSSLFGLSTSAFTGLRADKANRGFRLWCEKGTSVSESVDHTYGSSMFEKYLNQASSGIREMQQLWSQTTGGVVGSQYSSTVQGMDAADDNKSTVDSIGSVASNLASATGGATLNIPSIWQDSKFNRSYNIQFKFMSPYGDNASIFAHVIIPFLFILTCALPRQLATSGIMFPYVLQIDAPGWFSTPLGCINSLSFTKGGTDGFLCNDFGLPLVIEGTIGIGDLYNNLSLPRSYNEFVTNFGTTAFLNSLTGLTLYNAADPTTWQKLQHSAKNIGSAMVSPLQRLMGTSDAVQRYFGMV